MKETNDTLLTGEKIPDEEIEWISYNCNNMPNGGTNAFEETGVFLALSFSGKSVAKQLIIFDFI